MDTTLYHGSRGALDGSLLQRGLCLTTSAQTAEAYAGANGAVYAISATWPRWATEAQVRQVLAQEGIDVGEYVWEAIDRHLDTIAEYFDGVRYTDMDPTGGTHECYRLLEPVAADQMEVLS